MSVGEEGAHFRQSVDIGGLGLRVTAEAAHPIVQIVDRYQQDVRFGIFGPREKEKDKKKEQRDKWIFHGKRLEA